MTKQILQRRIFLHGIDEFCVKPDLTTLSLVPATEYLSSDKAKSLSLQK